MAFYERLPFNAADLGPAFVRGKVTLTVHVRPVPTSSRFADFLAQAEVTGAMKRIPGSSLSFISGQYNYVLREVDAEVTLRAVDAAIATLNAKHEKRQAAMKGTDLDAIRKRLIAADKRR